MLAEVVKMSTIVVRGLDESVKERLVAQAQRHGRSMEAEVRDILARSVSRPHIGLALLEVAREVGGVEGFEVPARTDLARVADFE